MTDFSKLDAKLATAKERLCKAEKAYTAAIRKAYPKGRKVRFKDHRFGAGEGWIVAHIYHGVSISDSPDIDSHTYSMSRDCITGPAELAAALSRLQEGVGDGK